MFKYIVNKEIELKLPNKFDAKALYQLIDGSREHLGRWLPWVKSTDNAEMMSTFIMALQEQYVSNHGFKAIIMYNGSLAGIIGHNSVEWDRRCATIGYWLAEPFQGKGIMTMALQAFIEYAFNTMKLNKIEITVAEENFKSKALPKKFGFKEEGLIRDAEWLNDKYVNHIIYGMLKDEWNRQ